MTTFVTTVRHAFRFLTEKYDFEVSSSDDSVVVYDSSACQVRVALERCDLCVDIRSREEPTFNQVHLGLYELVRLEAPSPSADPGPLGTRLCESLEEWVQ